MTAPNRYTYSAELKAEPDGSAINLWFPDVPGARTWGDNDAETRVRAWCVDGEPTFEVDSD